MLAQLPIRICDKQEHTWLGFVIERIGILCERIKNLRKFVAFVLEFHLFQLGDLLPFSFCVQSNRGFEKLICLVLLLEVGSKNPGSGQRFSAHL